MTKETKAAAAVRPVKVLTRPIIKKLHAKALRLGLNRTLSPADVRALPDKLFPVTMTLLHNDDHMRVIAVLNEAGALFRLDMMFEDFDKLPTVSVGGGE